MVANAACRDDGVPSAVERRARIFGHSAVDHGKDALRLTLNGQHPVKRGSRRGDEAAPRLDSDSRNHEPSRGGFAANLLSDGSRSGPEIERLLCVGMRSNAESAAHDEPLGEKTALGESLCGGEQRRAVGSKRFGGENLRADVRVQAGKAKVRMRAQYFGGHHFVTHVDSKLAFVAAGADESVATGLDSDVETENDVDASSVAADRSEPLELFNAIGDDVAQASGTCGLQLVLRLAGAVQSYSLRRESGSLGGDELAQRANVQSNRMPGEPAKKLYGGKCFGGVTNLDAAMLRSSECAVNGIVDLIEVDDEQRCAVLQSDIFCRNPAQQQRSPGVSPQNCPINRSTVLCSRPPAISRPAISWRLRGGVTNMNSAWSPEMARTLHHDAAAGTRTLW